MSNIKGCKGIHLGCNYQGDEEELVLHHSRCEKNLLYSLITNSFKKSEQENEKLREEINELKTTLSKLEETVNHSIQSKKMQRMEGTTNVFSTENTNGGEINKNIETNQQNNMTPTENQFPAKPNKPIPTRPIETVPIDENDSKNPHTHEVDPKDQHNDQHNDHHNDHKSDHKSDHKGKEHKKHHHHHSDNKKSPEKSDQSHHDNEKKNDDQNKGIPKVEINQQNAHQFQSPIPKVDINSQQQQQHINPHQPNMNPQYMANPYQYPTPNYNYNQNPNPNNLPYPNQYPPMGNYNQRELPSS